MPVINMYVKLVGNDVKHCQIALPLLLSTGWFHVHIASWFRINDCD